MGVGKTVGYCAQLRPYARKDTQLDVCGDIGLGVSGAVVAHLLKYIPSQQDNGSIHQVVMDNYFTSPALLCHLQKQSIAATTGTVRFFRIGNSPLKSVKEVEKSQRGTSVVAIETRYPAFQLFDEKTIKL